MVVRSLEIKKDPLCPRKKDEDALGPEVSYLSAAGALMYLTNNTRPDIAFAVSMSERFSSDPTKRHSDGIKHIFRYLQGTIDLRLFFSNISKSQLVGYADAEYLSDPHFGRSQIGYLFIYCNTAISWKSTKQTTAATSSNHAELLAIHEASRECIWLSLMALTEPDHQERNCVEYEYLENFQISARVPEDFKSVCGGRIPTSLKIYCKTHKWRARYNSEIGKICGLARFMEFYGITIYNLVLFDYHGDGVFNVKIYKEAAIEINYPTIEPNEWMLNKSEWKDEEFMVFYGNIQFQKSVAMLVYDGFLNKTEAYRISVNSADLQGDGIVLTMKSGTENFYKNFKHGNSVSLRFTAKEWKCEVEMVGGHCRFVKGWSDFVSETGLGIDDSILMYKMHNDIENVNNVNICIYKHDVYEKDLDRGNLFAPKSFLKIVSKDTLACGDMEIEHKFDDGEKGKGLLMEEADEINPLQEFCSWLPLIKDANIPKTNLKLK
ncbi:hypothetical protein AgCh_025158 [Apium graveolens]